MVYKMNKLGMASRTLGHRSICMLMFVFFALQLLGQNESYYSDRIAVELDGKREVKVKGGRVDILTEDYAIEVKKAPHWKHAIGQALWYAQQTNKMPGIILIMQNSRERKYGIMLQSTLDYAGLGGKVKVWFWPEDFGVDFQEAEVQSNSYRQALLSNGGCAYWLTRSSGKRHNKTCRYFGNTNGRCATKDEGTACHLCGG